tara:strand:- start:82 stop:327 length:246 start_codon:yes stop_codon:yes gene_type:complete
MLIFFLISILILAVYFIVKKVFYLAKRNLFKDQSAWSGKDIKIKYTKTKEISESTSPDNFLEIIAKESKVYLDDQSKKEAE